MKDLIKFFLKHSFVRYAMIGGLAFVLEYTSFYAMYVWLHVPLQLANVLSFCLGLVVAFSLNRLWAFSSHDQDYNKHVAHQFSYYTTLAVINLFLTVAIVAALKWLGIKPTIGKLIAMVVTSSWNFLLLKFVIFTHAE